MKQFCISSQFCGPQTTRDVGSGLYLFATELSKCAMPTMRVPLGIAQRLLQVESELPVEIPFRFENRLGRARGIDEAHFVVLAAQVHVRLHVDQLRVGRRRHFGHDFLVARAGRNGEIAGRRDRRA